MSITLWTTLLLACVVISLTPGAGAVNTMGNALAGGFRRAIWGILGQQAALIVLIAIVAAGVGVLVTTTPVLFEIIRYAGAAYLVYLGIRQLLQKPHAQDDLGEPVARESRWSMFRRGFLVNILNPKAIVFFLAFLPQFIRLDEPLLPQYVVVAVTAVVVDIIVMWGVFAVAAHAVRRYTRSARGQRVLSIVFGSLFIALGLALALIH